MRILIISDIHSNFTALEAVLASAGHYDVLWCLGDTIGYGPDPNECTAAMIERAEIVINGNHDLACIGELDLDDFNPDARTANIWNRKQLHPDYFEWLRNLSPKQEIDDRFTIAHASPREPVWEYLMTIEQADVNFTHFETQVCLIGHSHVQLGFRLSTKGTCERFLSSERAIVDLDGATRYIINPGSVGQPRDYDPRAAYAVYETEENRIYFCRVEYDVARVQEKMYKANLPIALIRRLEFGM